MTPTIRNDEDVILYPSRWKMALLALGSLVSVLMGVILWTISGTPGGAFLRAICIGDWLFFGYACVFAAGRLLLPRPSLILDERGVTDNASAVGAGLVRWNEITGVEIVERGFTRYLTMQVRDPEGVLARHPAVKRWVMRANWSLGTSPVTIPGTLPISLDELARMIGARLQDHGQETGMA